MTNNRTKKKVTPPRVELTEQDLRRFSDTILSQPIPALVKRTGLPYRLVYNVAHRRVKSITERHYRILFGEPPPVREPKKVDGFVFRTMVELWLYLNDGVTKSDLYREFYGKKQPKRVDYRIFTGQTKAVEPGLERMMRQKFYDAGFDRKTLERWMEELAEMDQEERVPYRRIRPILLYLKEELGIHPTRIMNRSFGLYESGRLKSVARNIYDTAVKLKNKAEKVLQRGSSLGIEKLKDDICGEKPGYTRYTEVEAELHFLRKYAKKSPKSYLGRGVWVYEQQKARRIPSWRAARIFEDCDRFISQTREMPLASLPRSRQKILVRGLLRVLITRTARMLSEQEGIIFEKQLLSPLHSGDEYRKQDHGFTEFDRVSGTLGMRKKAFDLMVAKNCELFRKVGRYDKRWYLSDLYLKELSEKPYFELVSAKYEMLAKELNHREQANECMN
jgi:hypothetical protein